MHIAAIAEALFVLAYIDIGHQQAFWIFIGWPIVYFHIVILAIAAMYFLQGNHLPIFASVLPSGTKTTGDSAVTRIGNIQEIGTRLLFMAFVITFPLWQAV